MSRIPKIMAGIPRLHALAAPTFFPIRADHLIDRNVKIYARVGRRAIGGKRLNMVTIATIDVMPVAMQRKGLMREVFEFAESYAASHDDLHGVYVESANNVEALAPFLERRSYTFRADTGFDEMMYGDWYWLKNADLGQS